jgi:hypothetical protein
VPALESIVEAIGCFLERRERIDDESSVVHRCASPESFRDVGRYVGDGVAQLIAQLEVARR